MILGLFFIRQVGYQPFPVRGPIVIHFSFSIIREFPMFFSIRTYPEKAVFPILKTGITNEIFRGMPCGWPCFICILSRRSVLIRIIGQFSEVRTVGIHDINFIDKSFFPFRSKLSTLNAICSPSGENDGSLKYFSPGFIFLRMVELVSII